MGMSIRMINPGLLTTLQDTGRLHYLSEGVPVSGSMDRHAAATANLALGNEPGAAVIEFLYGRASFIAETDLLLAFSGYGASPLAGALRLPPNRPVFVPGGTRIDLKENPEGMYTYLAIAGGWDVPPVLGSYSTYLAAAMGGLEGRALRKDDILHGKKVLDGISSSLLQHLHDASVSYPSWFLPDNPDTDQAIRVIRGPESGWFAAGSFDQFCNSPYTIGLDSNRMGYRLLGSPLKQTDRREMVSTCVLPGTVQVTGTGQAVVLMADCQTTGGYPRIAQVIAADLPRFAQFRPNTKVLFKEISLEEAERCYLEHENTLRQVKAAVGFTVKYVKH